MIDYVVELERLSREQRWVIVAPALDATRRLRFKTPHLARLMGDVWTELDRFVDAGRPHTPWHPIPHNCPEWRLSHALTRFYAADYWHEIGGDALL